MRTLVLFRGAPGCGKSCFIEDHDLESYTLSADNIRLLVQSPIIGVDGNLCISQKNDKFVWNKLFEILNERMSHGEFTVIDATNSKTEEMRRYRDLAKQYKYRIILIDMTDLPIEDCKRRNRLRTLYKQVPDFVIDKMYARFKGERVPSGIKVISPKDFDNEISWKIPDLSEYKKIVHIGDIHGCNSVLQQYLNDGIRSDTFYIFVGDYIDRGIENAEVIKFLFSIMDYPNVVLLEGNHELNNLNNWANNLGVKRSFYHTQKQLEEGKISKSNANKLYRKLNQLFIYTYKGKKVYVTHGGISLPIINPIFTATEQFINGVGFYEDMLKVNASFLHGTENELAIYNEIYQVHGHRNVEGLPITVNERCFNLEGNVEFGGDLRCLELSLEGFREVYTKNHIFKPIEHKTIQSENITQDNFIEILRSNKYITEQSFGNISSFTFTREAFDKGKWDDINVKARGLYININTGEIVSRSYNKFFNVDQQHETKIKTLQNSLKFPLDIYQKENGYLGIVGYDSESDELIISSKSCLTGIYSEWFKNLFEKTFTRKQIEEIKSFIKDNNVSLVFEVIDIKNDPHIIEYKESHIVLLDIIKRTIEFEKLPYEAVVSFGNTFGIKYKHKENTFNNWDEFYTWYSDIMHPGYIKNIEGFVVEDATEFMFKIKLPYYLFWKKMRSVVSSVRKQGIVVNTGFLTDALAADFYAWIRSLDRKELEKDIIYLRNKFELSH